MPLIAAVQMNSGPDKVRNVETAEKWVRKAASLGAQLVGLPENFSWMGPDSARAENAETLDGPTLRKMVSLAGELKITLLAGSIAESGAPDGRFFNTSVLFGPGGERLAIYRKIHLFDVEVGDGAVYRESSSIAPGNQVVASDTKLGKIGLSVCYDLRFPELYRKLAIAGAVLLAVPSAFTLVTGKDHWEVLLRARAIENQAYVLAPAQWGRHSEKRVTYGNAMVVDPWGTVLARAAEGEGLAVAEMDTSHLERIRKDLPSLSNRRL